MKVCFVIAGFGQGGAQRQCISIINELQKDLSFDVHVIYSHEGENFEDLELFNITLHKLSFRSSYSIFMPVELYGILKEVSPSIVFSWLHASDVYVGLIRWLIKASWVVAERDSFYPDNWKYNLRRFLVKHADLIISNSVAGKTYWQNVGVSHEKCKVIPNILLENQILSLTESKFEKEILYAGRLESQKNIAVLVDVFSVLANRHPDWCVSIVGSGSMFEFVFERIKGEGLSNFKLHPFTKNIGDFYGRADVFVNISHHEGTPNTVIENVACNNVVVLSSIAEHRDLVGGEYPYLVEDYLNPSAVLSAIERAAAATSGCLNYAQSKILEFSPEIVVDRYKKEFINV